jgi:HD-GYP domain-containing protein (c-di-GMP phosphodiesterase class II)
MSAEALVEALSASPLLAGVEVRPHAQGALLSRAAERVLVLADAESVAADFARDLLEHGGGSLVLIGAPPAWLAQLPLARAPLSLVPRGAAIEAVALAVLGLFERADLRSAARARAADVARFAYERGELVEIARAIARERDIERLLGLILEKSRYVTGADAGSIYVVEGESSDPGGRHLHFKLSQNDSISYESQRFTMPVSQQSIAGAAVLGAQPINIADVYELGEQVPYRFDPSFDRRMGYRTRSMLAVPMISAEDEVIGVIQLINKKRDAGAQLRSPEDCEREVVPFDAHSEELLGALSAQAGIALENALLYEEIREIFEGFVRASVQAIEQRDPTTSGHSLRVSVLSCRLAERIDGLASGPHRDTRFSRRDLQELKYAALLHDFGKIGVREQVLIKAKKLYPNERAAIRARIDFALKAAEAELLEGKLAAIERGAGKSDLDALQARYDARCAQLRDAWAVIERADEPSVLSEGDFSRIAEIAAIDYADLEGRRLRLLDEREVIALKITRGSLSPAEVEEIRSHVVHTYNFLTKIPWGRSMQRIPEIARAHHEKLNGRGYPQGMNAVEIPLQSKIMTVADICDALTASDRPYKKALATERALEILGFEVEEGHLDAELVKVFREAEIYKLADQALEY